MPSEEVREARRALYSTEELKFVHQLIASKERGDITDAELRKQITMLHDAKVLFDARMLTPAEEVERGLVTVEGHGDFKIPERGRHGFPRAER
jgi:hypothetical protein